MVLNRRPVRALVTRTAGAVLLVALFVLFAIEPHTAAAQTPPAEETEPTKTGLGDCDNTMRVGVLNDDFNTLPEDLVTRHGNGGFEAVIVTNCIPVTINFYVVNNVGARVPFAEGKVSVGDAFDEVEWLDISEIEYERHDSDVYEGDPPRLKFRAGSPVLDDNGNAIPIPPADDEAVTAYRYTLEYPNEAVNIGGDNRRPLVAEQDYAMVFEITPFDGAPDNFIHEFTFEVIAKIGGQWWDKLLRIATPTYWVESAWNFVTSGGAQGLMGGMCVVTTRFMRPSEIVALDRYDSDGDGRLTENDDFVDGANDPNVQNANGNCKRPQQTPEEELETIRTAAFIDVNERRAIAGLPPLEPNRRSDYVSELLDGRERELPEESVGSGISFGLNHLTLAPRIVLDKAGMAPPASITGGGITTFTGLLTGTPPELTYERGIVRLGWSAMMNVMVAVLGLMIAWIGFSQIIRSFTGNQRGMADWRELIPRLVLAILAALTSYWWCSLLVDVADGISRYIAATMRVTPADITLTLGQAVLAIVIRSAGSYALSFIPLAGLLALAMKMMMNFLILVLMISYSLMLLMMIGQFVLRIVMINLMIILSPLGMIMWALPETSAWGKKWVHEFAVALLTQALQLVVFALSTWFIREATPVGVVFDTGSFPSALQSLLPTQMIWALALGTMAAYLTTKIPGMLGSSVYEGFQSMFAMAAVGALALTAGPGGMSRLGGFLGIGGPPGPGAGGMPRLPGMSPVGQGIVAAVSTGSRHADMAMSGAGRMVSNAITGNRGSPSSPSSSSVISSPSGAPQMPTPGAAPSSAAPSSVAPSTGPGAGSPAPTPSVRARPIPGGANWFPQGRQYYQPQRGQPAGIPTPQGQGDTGAASSPHFTPAGSYQSPIPPRPEGMTDEERIHSVMPSNYQPTPGSSAVSQFYVREQQPGGGSSVRPTTGWERALIREMGVGGFNQGLSNIGGGAPSSQAVSTSQAAPTRPAPSQLPDYQQYSGVRQGLGVRFEQARQNNLQALDNSGHLVSEGGRSRVASPQERSLIRQFGMGAFNSVLQGYQPPGMSRPAQRSQAVQGRPSTSAAAPAQPSAGPTRTDYPEGTSDTAILMNETGKSMADIQSRAQSGFRAINAGWTTESYPAVVPGTNEPRLDAQGNQVYATRMRGTTAQERAAIENMGTDRFNAVFEPGGVRGTETARAGEQGEQAQQQREARGRGVASGIGQRIARAGRDFREGYTEARRQLNPMTVTDARTGRVTQETADGMRARDILGPEFNHVAGRRVSYEQEGTWINEGGRLVNMDFDSDRDMSSERHVREAFGDDAAYSHHLANDIRLDDSGAIDPQTNLPFVIENRSAENSGIRSATEAEAAAIRSAGVEAFNRTGAGRREFMGQGVLANDEGVRRLATSREQELIGRTSLERANVIGQRQIAVDESTATQQPFRGATRADEIMGAGDGSGTGGGGNDGDTNLPRSAREGPPQQ